MTEQENLNRRYRFIISRLKKLQRKDGSWADNNFINALIAYSLWKIDAPKTMQNKTIDFIVTQKKPEWSWNYNSQKLYPDDLDDTFCSLIAINRIKPEIIDDAAYKHIAALLAAAESRKDGPYFTWLGKIWNDIDPVVNANISYFVSLTGIEMPGTTEYIDTCINTKFPGSKYYHNPFLAYYFVARNYRGKKRKILIRKIRYSLKKATENKKMISTTNCALAACALLYLNSQSYTINSSVKRLIEKITLNIKTEDKKEPEPLYIEKIRNGKIEYAHSYAFTLAVCGEALTLWKKQKRKKKYYSEK